MKTAIERLKELCRLPMMFRNASVIASDPNRFVSAMRDNPFNPGDRVKHGFYGWRGKVDHVENHGAMAGAVVVWNDPETYEVVGEPVGTPVWYAAMALQRAT